MHKREKGFTLIEIVVVLVIIGVLAAIALTNLSTWSRKSWAPEAIFTMKNVADQLDACISKGGDTYANLVNNCALQMGLINTSRATNLTTAHFEFSPQWSSWGYVLQANNVGDRAVGGGVNCPSGGGTSYTNSIGYCVSNTGVRVIVGGGIYARMF